MADNLGLMLSLRFVRSRRKGALTRFISFASTCGIAVGVFAAIVGLSAMNGFEYELEHRVLSVIPSARLTAPNGYFKDADDLQRILREEPRVTATAPAAEVRAILSANRAFAPLLITGIDPQQEKDVIAIQRFINTDLSCLDSTTQPKLTGACAFDPADKATASDAATTANSTSDAVTADNSSTVAASTAANSSSNSTAAVNSTSNAVTAENSSIVSASVEAASDTTANSSDSAFAAGGDSNDAADGATASVEAPVEAVATAAAESKLGSELAKAEKVAAKVEERLPRIIIGSGIAKKLKVGAGDVVTMMIMGNQGESHNNLEAIESSLKAPERKKALIVGTIHLGGQLDGSLALMDIGDVLDLADLQGPNAIHIRTAELKNTNYIIYDATSGKIKENANLSTWMNSQGKLYHDIQMVRQIMFIAMFLVLAVACFNIVSNLMMMTGEKRREIAILLTMGMKPVQIVRTFSIMGIITGAYGTLIGLVLGVIVSLGVSPFTASFRDWFGFDLLNEDVYFINFIPSRLSLIDVLVVTAAALLMSWLAALYPAMRASRVHPAQELNL